MTRGELLDEIEKIYGEEIYGRDAIDEILDLERQRIINLLEQKAEIEFIGNEQYEIIYYTKDFVKALNE